MTNQEMVNVFSQIRPNSTFLSIKEYINNYGEKSNFGIIFHVDYLKALKKSKEIIENSKVNNAKSKEAKKQILSSLASRIDAYQIPLEERDSPYLYFRDEKDNFIKGIKAHKDTGNLYLFGFVISKQIIDPIEYNHVNSSILTLEKQKLMNLTPISKFRQYKLLPKSYKEIKVENLIIR